MTIAEEFTTSQPPDAVLSRFGQAVAQLQGHTWTLVTPTTAAITRKVVAPWSLLLLGAGLVVLIAYQFADAKTPVIWLVLIPLLLPVFFARETRTLTVAAEEAEGATVVRVSGMAGERLVATLGSAAKDLA